MKTPLLSIIAILFCVTSIYAQFSGGSGTKDDPYQVSSPEDLSEVRNYLSSYFIQINNIDLRGYDHDNDGKGWMPIGGATSGDSFTGNYNGQGFYIDYLTINRPTEKYVGLFGSVGTTNPDTKISITNLGLKNINITANIYIGGLIGELNSNKNTNVEYCYILGGKINGNSNIGGLIGSANSYIFSAATKERPTVSKCFSYVDVIWSQINTGRNFGGFIGFASAINIDNCYSRSSVTVDNSIAGIDALEDVGGFIGSATNKTTVSNCYCTGQVIAIGEPPITHIGAMIGLSEGNTTFRDSFWDTETTGQTESDGGDGRTTTELNTMSTFNNYDFTNVWGIDPNINDGYPYLMGYYWSVLPIKLNYFDAYNINNQIELRWETASEINNDFFTIERSIDGINFKPIEIIKGAGNSSKVLNYSTIDKEPEIGINYYRLKQTDYDGKFEYSSIVNITQKGDLNTISIYPNPNNGNFTISTQNSQVIDYQIIDYSGKAIKIGTINSLNSNLNISDLSPGIYFLLTTLNNNNTTSRKIIVQ